MGLHTDSMERTRDLTLMAKYVARHVDRERQPGRSPDGVPDDEYDPAIDRHATDLDVWDR